MIMIPKKPTKLKIELNEKRNKCVNTLELLLFDFIKIAIIIKLDFKHGKKIQF